MNPVSPTGLKIKGGVQIEREQFITYKIDLYIHIIFKPKYGRKEIYGKLRSDTEAIF